MSRRKRWEIFLLAIVICLSMTACGKQEPSGVASSNTGYKNSIIRINSTTAYGSAVLQIMKSNDILKKYLPEGVTIEWSNINSGADIRDSMVAGKIDIACIATPNAIVAVENGLPLNILGNSVIQSAKIYSNNPEIKTLDDIKETDKVSIVNLGSAYNLALKMLSKDKYNNANRFDKSMTVMDYPEVLASLASSKDLDCAVIAFPYLSQADKMNNLNPVLDLTGMLKDNDIGTTFIAARQFSNDNPALIDAFYKASQEVIDFMNQQPAEAAKLLADFYGQIPAGDIEEQIKSAPPALEISESAYDNIAALMYEVKMLPAPPKKFSELPNYNTIPKIK